jgi:hypothetical protein
LRRDFDTESTADQLAAAAARAEYHGSPEHKAAFSWLGPKKLRSDATPCPKHLKDPDMLTGWLRDAIRQRQCSSFWEGEFPKYVWVRQEDLVYEGRLINQGQGNYKGYPLDPSEFPKELS